MAKCRKLLQENEELGKIISSGNVAQLEHDLAYHKQLINEASENEQNINSFLLEVDNQMDLIHSVVNKLQETNKSIHSNESKKTDDTDIQTTNLNINCQVTNDHKAIKEN